MSEELLSLEGKLKRLLENLEKTEEVMKNTPSNEWDIEGMTETMISASHETDDVRQLMKDTDMCRDYELLCNSWRQCCISAFTKLLFCRHENTSNDELLKKQCHQSVFCKRQSL